MTIYLGDSGHVELLRPTTEWMRTTINDPDINVSRSRFSVNFYGDQDGAANTAANVRRGTFRDQAEDSLYNFITGDRVTIRSVSGNNLAFIPDVSHADGNPHRSITAFIHLDPNGGLRLYRNFSAALSGTQDGALDLQALDTTLLDRHTGPDGADEVTNRYQLVEMRAEQLADTEFRCLGNVTSYELVSQRENIDITTLNQAYRQQYEAGIIQGSGRISVFWEHQLCNCEQPDAIRYPEVSYFLAAVILRLEQGADFGARFYLTKGDGNDDPQSMWYDCPKCIITNCTVSVEPTQIITADIDFITSGKIRLKQGFPVDRLRTEESDISRISDGYVLDEFARAPMELQADSNR